MGESENPVERRARSFMVQERVAEQVKALVDEAFEKFLKDEPVVLTRTETQQLYTRVVEEILDGILDE